MKNMSVVCYGGDYSAADGFCPRDANGACVSPELPYTLAANADWIQSTMARP
ncbi:MAG TPA: hypothetical protein VK509_05850 [Polyangiales bacterium]|nr:hypothetical protein [Polyangiales bacterium]